MTASDYFAVTNGYFWKWEEEGEVIAINKGGTIAYRQFIEQLLSALADQGLPPFGAFLLAVIATNYSTDDPIGQVEVLMRSFLPHYKHAEEDRIDEYVRDAIQFMRCLSSLPMKYTTGDKRVQLFHLIFTDCYRKVSAKASIDLPLAMKAAYPSYDVLHNLANDNGDNSYARLEADFRCLALLLRKFPDTQSLINQLAGIPVLEEPLLPEEEEETVPGDFIQSLIDNYKTFSVGALIRSIWSGMNIPIHHALPSRQPMGGISDLGNKGDFDKLLVSEFANDEWLFLSRIANNEALYLHRETPPGADDLQRTLLLDISLNSWGTPKVLAYAVLLAIMRHPRTDIRCTAFAVGNSFYPVKVDTVDALIDSLQMLDRSLHPAEGLRKFFEIHAAAGNTELFFIASPDTMRQPAIQKVISDHYLRFKYWVNVGQDGTIEFYRNQHKGKKLLQRLQLPLEQLWKQPPSSRPAAGREKQPPLQADRVPILFPTPVSPKKLLVAEDDELYAVTKERRLFRKVPGNDGMQFRGWELVLDHLSGGITHYAIGPDIDGRPLFLCFRSGSRELMLYDLSTGEYRSASIPGWKASDLFPDFFYFKDHFFYKGLTRIWSITYDDKGIIVEETFREINPFKKHLEELEHRHMQEIKKINFNWSVLKNVNNVYISAAASLVLNTHELVLTASGQLQFLPLTKPDSKIAAQQAVWDQHDTFTFSEGSQLKILRSGMIILKSSALGVAGVPVDTIYIPTALNASLAAATDEEFAGNLFYYPNAIDPESSLIKVAMSRFFKEKIGPFIMHILEQWT